MAGISAAPFDPQLFEAERFGQEMENFLNSLPPDPLAPLPSSLHVDVNVAGLLASSTEVSFQGTSIYEGDILVVGTRSRNELGGLSARYETGGRGVGAVSTGRGRGGKPDLGGVSYGSYQLTSQTALKIKGKTVIVHDGGNAAIFLKSEGAPWAADFAGLEPGSKAFSDVWRGIAASDPLGLHAAEHEFIKRTHYDPAVARILSSTGVDISQLDPAVQDVLWSTAVQHGSGSASNGATRIFVDAINKTNSMTTRASASYSATLVTNVYARRTSYWPSDYARYQSEQSMALKMLGGN